MDIMLICATLVEGTSQASLSHAWCADAASAVLGQGEGPGARIPDDKRPTLLRASHFGADGMLRLIGSRVTARPDDVPLPSMFWAAGFSFSCSRLLQEVLPQNLPWFFLTAPAYLPRIGCLARVCGVF